MKVITHTITHQAKSDGGQIESIIYSANFAAIDIETIMYQAKFAGGRSRLDLLLPSFLPSREEKKKQERIKQSIDSGAEWHNPHTDCERIETKKQEQKNRPLGSRGVLHTPTKHLGRDEQKIQEQKNCPLGSRGVSHTPPKHIGRDEQKIQDRIFCPLRGHAVGRMQYAPTSYRQERMFQIILLMGREEKKIQDRKNRPLGCRGVLHTLPKHLGRDETKMQERIKQSIYSGAEWHTPFMRQGERDAVWREAFLKQRARVAVWRDSRLEEKSSHARLQLMIFGENSKPYKSSLVDLSEQLRDIFSA